jgi:enoyl-CoA hydratase/carnithine racemase
MLSRCGALLVIELDVPARRNAISRALCDGFAEVLDEAALDAATHAVVLTGSPQLFSSGGDFADMRHRDLAGWREHFDHMARLTRRLVAFPKPTIAAVEGWAIGGGMALACCCDRIVAGSGASFVYGFARMAVLPDVGFAATLAARVGAVRARRIMCWGETFDAQAAHATGIVDAVAPAGRALEVALALAERACAAPLPSAWLKSHTVAGLERALSLEKNCASILFTTNDHAEGLVAFRGRRAPVFAGR